MFSETHSINDWEFHHGLYIRNRLYCNRALIIKGYKMDNNFKIDPNLHNNESKVCKLNSTSINSPDTVSCGQAKSFQPDYSYSSNSAKLWHKDDIESLHNSIDLNQKCLYKVQYGDCLNSIALRAIQDQTGRTPSDREVNQEVSKIVKLNEAKYPSLNCNNALIMPGWELQMPDTKACQLPNKPQPKPVEPPVEPTTPVYKPKPVDTSQPVYNYGIPTWQVPITNPEPVESHPTHCECQCEPINQPPATQPPIEQPPVMQPPIMPPIMQPPIMPPIMQPPIMQPPIMPPVMPPIMPPMGYYNYPPSVIARPPEPGYLPRPYEVPPIMAGPTYPYPNWQINQTYSELNPYQSDLPPQERY